MANLSKIKRDRMLAYIEKLKQEHTDDESIIMFNEIENSLTEKRYGLVFEEHTEAVDEMLQENIPVLTADPKRRICKDKDLPWNFIIEGDNLQALYLLEKTHKGKVDCIYIDPPYNTGARDWKYNNDYVDSNDTYRHSKWLSMMKSRLLAAKKLLNPICSVLIVTIDEKEYHHLGCLLEELFPEARMQMISDVISSHGSWRDDLFARCNEFVYYLFFGDASVVPQADDLLHEVKHDTVRWDGFVRRGATGKRTARPNQFYPIFFDSKTKRYAGVGDPLPIGMDRNDVSVPDGCIAVFPMSTDGSEAAWGTSKQTFLSKLEKGYIKFGKWDEKKNSISISHLQTGGIEGVETGEIPVLGRDEDGSLILDTYDKQVQPMSVWYRTSHTAGDHGASILRKIIPNRHFPYPKSLYATHDAIQFVIANKPNATVVDFFAGSGTTMHAVNLLNAEDGGHRKCIMVTNNEVSESESKDLTKKGYKTGDDEWEKLGIARYITWPRTVCSIEGCDTNGEALKGSYYGSDIPMSDGFTTNVKYFKCDWVPRNPGEGNLTEMLFQHICEMIELENAIEIDGQNYLVILNEDQADLLEKEWTSHSELKGIYVSRNVLLTTKQNELFHTVPLHTIPDYYFDMEMKEVGETW